MFAKFIYILLVLVNGALAFSPISSYVVRGRGNVVMSARLPFIAGNWKMNTDLESAIALASEVRELTKGADPKKVEIAVCPPFPFIRDVQKAVAGSNVKVSSQNCYYEQKGAFTGAVSAPMLKSLSLPYTLIGHSERRKIFGEQDSEINKIVRSVHAAGITPILCIGETRDEYELGLNEETCTVQLSKDLAGFTPEAVSKFVIAYEPVWAIGTGLTATPEIAQSVHYAIRKWLRKIYGADVAEAVRIQYGGSVTPETIDELMKCPDIDGALVGGAALTAKSFARICMYNP